MCLPMTPAGPESEVMNPILTVSAVAGETATTAARSPARTARVIVRTGSLLLVRLAAAEHSREPPIELLIRRARPSLRPADELVRDASARDERGPAAAGRDGLGDDPTPREALAEVGGEAHGDRHHRDPLTPVEIAHERHHGSVVQRIVNVVGENALEPGGSAALDQRAAAPPVARAVVLHSVAHR